MKTIFVTVYSPPNSCCNLREWSDGFIVLHQGLSKQDKLFYKFMSDKFLSNHVDRSTRLNNLLDLICSNVPEWFGECRVENNSIYFDHKTVTCDLLVELIEYESSNDLTNIYSINIPLLKIPNSESQDWDKYKLFLNKHDWFNIIDGSDHD